jgi:hypothetical protein
MTPTPRARFDPQWKPPAPPEPRWHRRGPVTHTPWYWRAAGVAALVPGVTVLTLMEWRACRYRYPIRSLRSTWNDWYEAFFA